MAHDVILSPKIASSVAACREEKKIICHKNYPENFQNKKLHKIDVA